MKKFVALILAVVMVFALATSASAVDYPHTDTTTTVPTSFSGTVTVSVSGNVSLVYSVKVDWESLDFTYAFTGWNDSTHSYDGNWTYSSANVKITNNSNQSVVYSASAEKTVDGNSPLNGVNLLLDTDDVLTATETPSATLAAAGATATFKVVVTGAPSAATEQSTKHNLGTVTVSLSKVTA